MRAGGRIETTSEGVEEFVIPVQIPVASPLAQSWEAEDIEGDVNFTPSEMEEITFKARNREDYVRVWQVAGPFSKEGIEGLDLFDVEFGPENDRTYAIWKEMPVGKGAYEADVINLHKFFGYISHSVAYLRTSVWIENSQMVLFEIGSDDGVKVWVNDELVHHKNLLRGHNQAEDVVEVDLEEGWNTIFMKVTQGDGGWGASLVITDLEREPVSGLRYKSE